MAQFTSYPKPPGATGDATEAKQDVGNASLASIDGKITTVDTDDVTVTNGAGASAVNIQDGGNSITVDGTVSSAQSGTWNINNISGTISLPTGASTEATLSSLNAKVTTVNTGAVTISTALPAGSNSIGILGANDGVDIGDVTINNSSGAQAVPIRDGGNSITVDGTVSIGTALPAGSNSIGILGANSGVDIGDVTINNASGGSAVNIQDGGNSITVDGSVSIGTALPAGSNSIGILGANSGVDIGDVTINNASGASAVNVQDGGNSLTVDGAVTVTGDASASTLSGFSGTNSVRISRPGNWSITHSPAANTQATITRAAVASTRHVCTAISASFVNSGAGASVVTLNLRDGVTGAGTILWSTLMSILTDTGDICQYVATGLNIVGSSNTAMTLEFATAGGSDSFENVALSGYDVT